MITFYIPGEPALELADPAQCAEFTRRAVWIDLCELTPEEEQELEVALGLDIPTRKEMQASESLSRLYKEGNVLYLTATVLVKAQIERPESAAVTFILTPKQLVTLRYETPMAFQAFRARREANVRAIAAVVFLPPTLVASIYGMNFELMPELKWAAGYPFAIVLMVISAVLPYVSFKRKGWL